MARYNSSSATTTINGTATVTSPYSGAFTGLTGTAPYTVTLPPPTLYPGTSQTFYNSTAGTVTLSTPSGLFGGLGASGAGTLAMPTNTVTTVTSDGTNYIVLSEDGSALVATTGSFTSNVDMSGSSATVTISPQILTISPTGAATINNVVIGGTTRQAGSFTSLAANSTVSLTANTASSSTSTGTLVVTGGIGATGTIYAGGFNGNLTGNVTGNLTGTVQTAAQPNITSLGTLTGLTVNGRLQNAGGLKTYSVATGNQGNVNAVYEIMKISRDNVNWSANTVYEITVYSTYYPAGGYVKYLLSYGYFNDGSLVCTYAGGSGMLRVYLGSEVTVNANLQYRPVFVDLPPYMQCSVEVRYSSTEVASLGAITANAQVFFSGIMTASGGTGAYYNGNTHLVPSGGNLGIGTTSPGSILEVRTTTPIVTLSPSNYTNQYQTTLGTRSGAEAFLIFGNNSLNEIRAGRSNTGGYLDFYTNNTLAQTSASDGKLVMRMDASGSLLLATTTDPTYGSFPRPTLSIKQLNDSGTGYTAIQIEAAGDQSVLGLGYNGDVFAFNTSYRATGAYRGIAFGTSNQERMRISAAGVVTIGGNRVLKANDRAMWNGAAESTSCATIISNNGDYVRFTDRYNGDSSVFEVVTGTPYGIKIKKAGWIYYYYDQDIITQGTTGYVTMRSSKNTGFLQYQLITNTGGQWDGLIIGGVVEMAANDVLNFYVQASDVTSMDAGTWTNCSIIWHGIGS